MSRLDLELIAHRGYARRAPENTIAAVTAALVSGARFVEIDVQLSRDGVPFLMHDRSLERMCGVAAALGELSSPELAALQASERGKFGERFAAEPVARLSSFVGTIVAHEGVHAFVELKRASIERFGADRVLDVVLPELEPIAGRCTLISFDLGVLALSRARSALPVGPVLVSWLQAGSDEVARLRPELIFCDVEKLPQVGLLRPRCDLAVYEVDDPQQALELHTRGVRFVETFAIGEMLEALA